MTLAYDNAGRRTSLTLANGNSVTYAYDSASRLTSLTYKQGATVLGDLTYTYDAASNRTVVGGSFARTGLPQAVASATYNANNQQLTFGNATLTYDFNGNQTTATDPSGSATYTWDSRNRLTGITAPGLTASFVYDPLGRRTTKTITGVSTSFLYDGLNPVQELSGTTPTANLLTGLGIDEYFSRTDASGSSALLTDALGSTVALADATGAVQTQYTYEPFGGTSATGASSGNTFKYTGREDDGTGLYYYRARYYHPRLQRFLSEDPIGLSGGDIDLYSYVGNSPVNLNDPTGEILPTVIGGAFGGAVGGATAGFITGFGAAYLSGNSISAALQSGAIGAGIGAVGGAIAGASIGLGIPGGLGFAADVGWGFDLATSAGEAAALTSKLGAAGGLLADLLFTHDTAGGSSGAAGGVVGGAGGGAGSGAVGGIGGGAAGGLGGRK